MTRQINKFIRALCMLLVAVLADSCNTTKYVSDGDYLLDDVDISTSAPGISGTDLETYLVQQPNFKVFGLTKLRLNTYNLSGRDTSKKRNKWLRKVGEPPVIYDEFQTKKSDKKLQQYFKSKGYLNAVVTDSVAFKGKKAKVFYKITENNPYRVRKLTYDLHSDTVLAKLLTDPKNISTKLDSGMLFDSDKLNEERNRLATIARRKGYYYFNKDNISYLADSSLGSNQVDLTLVMRPYYVKLKNGEQQEQMHPRFTIRNVSVFTLNNSNSRFTSNQGYDTLNVKPNVNLLYKNKPLLRPKVIADNLRITPGIWYNEGHVNRTYTKMSSLGIVRSTDIHFIEVPGEENQLDCEVVLTPNKLHSFSLDVEGTNSAGDLGFAVSAGVQNRNLFHGSEILAVKFRFAEEAVSSASYSNISDFLSDHVQEFDGEVSLTFPRFMFPFLNQNFKRRINSTTSFTLAYDRQYRPQYDRIISTAGVKYRWDQRRYYNYTIDLFNVNYVYLPWISQSFKNRYSDPKYSVLMYSYSDHFIFSSGASMAYSDETNSRKLDKHSYKLSFESAGNLFYLLSKAGAMDEKNGQYEFLNIPYSQYLKGEFDYSFSKYIDERNSIVFHSKIGVEVPYGNAETVPYEKRFFSGGANAVRGWTVRTLGPGAYKSPYSQDFVSQSGNIELALNLEYRSNLFWRFKGAAFIDAGNVWNIKNYEFQPEGTFHFDEFYKQIGVAYGLGLRCDFTYFLIRMDVGMKTYDPSLDGSNRWRFHDVTWSDDFAFHFAIGYPF